MSMTLEEERVLGWRAVLGHGLFGKVSRGDQFMLYMFR